MRAILGAIILMTLISVGAIAQETGKDKAGTLLPGCKAALAGTDRSVGRKPDNRQLRMTAGRCIGIIEGLGYLADRLLADSVSCAPADATDARMIHVVIAYIEAQPQRKSEDFRKLTLGAFRAAWPCPTTPPLIGVQ